MRHAAALRAGLAGHTVGGGGIERPFLRQGEVPPLPGRVPPGRGLLPARETAHAGAQSLL
ncbi:hypothetical protein PL418_04200 [Barnesiella intestinihominis]|uniref:hypothetical protein n=1 Tax=Barnesiella intestinihominis TaxID=487174 RepID=UPI001899449B|nr:hypothetical protein [Barnesiella intestinihominis]MDB0680783.1 hypothetical protein [Barnesiella intestinihominis]